MKELYDLNLEKALISAFLQWPETYIDTAPYLRNNDFFEHNSVIYDVIGKIIDAKETPSSYVISTKLSSIGITLPGLSIQDYLNSVSRIAVKKEEVPNIAREIKKKTLIRRIVEQADNLKRDVLSGKDDKIIDIVNKVDHALGQSLIDIDDKSHEVTNLYEKLPDLIEERGNKPVDNVGYLTPYPLFNDYYSGLRTKNIYLWASKSGAGKSTFLIHCLDNVVHTCNPDKDLVGIYLDTELSEEDQMIRLAAMKSGVPYYLLDSGQWRTDSNYYPLVVAELKRIRDMKNKRLFFRNVGRLGINDLSRFIRHFIYKYVGRTRKAVGVYDYIKVTPSDYDNQANKAEWQVGLNKLQVLKDLADEFDMPWASALQTNRQGTTTNKMGHQVTDDETIFSISSRVDWLVAYMGILRRKTPDEIAEDGIEFGTHKMIKTKDRYQGKLSMGHHDLVKMISDKKVVFKNNFLNYDFTNFNVTEKGCLRDIVQKQGKVKLDTSA